MFTDSIPKRLKKRDVDDTNSSLIFYRVRTGWLVGIDDNHSTNEHEVRVESWNSFVYLVLESGIRN